MNKCRATLKNKARTFSTRKCPWSPLDDEPLKTLKPGDVINVDMDSLCYDWTDNAYYEAFNETGSLGYIRVDALTIERR